MNLIIDQSDWAVVRLTGTDRIKSLNNLCTQDLKKLQPGQTSEGFITNPQGKTAGFVSILLLENEIILRTVPGGFVDFMPIFQKYSIFDETQLEDLTDNTAQWLLTGNEIRDWLLSQCKDLFAGADQAVNKVELFNFNDVLVANDNSTGLAGILVVGPPAIGEVLLKSLREQSRFQFKTGNKNDWGRLRIINGWPVYGQDIRPDNLPQEIDRDKTAISFTKGCYLGQETVARLDALGHVNRMLMGFTLQAEGSQSFADYLNLPLVNEQGQTVGDIRSATSGRNNNEIAGLALMRVKALESTVFTHGELKNKVHFYKLEEFRRIFQE